MKIKVSAHITAILFIATLVGLGDEVKGQQKAAFPEWAFCVAYQVRDADERDARPVNPKAGKDPFDDGDSRIPHGLIDDKNIVDVAALTTRVVKSGVLKREVAKKVIQSSTQGTKRHPIMECYEPHHIFVFYNHDGSPMAAIEVCFICNRVVMTPETRPMKGMVGPFETADLAGLAKIATEAGLDLKPYASLDEYVQRLETWEERLKKEGRIK